ncbi:MAG TPA: CRISPR-associated helicase Cas3' [Longimicrobiales bacterium]
MLWAKSRPRYELWRHLLDTAAVAYELVPRLLPTPDWPLEWIAALVGLHDVGKADPLFQWKVPELCVDLAAAFSGDERRPPDGEVLKFRHEFRSRQILSSQLAARSRNPGDLLEEEARKAVARAAAMHHGFEAGRGREDPEKCLPKRAARWNPIREELCTLVFDACGVEGPVPPPPAHLDAFGARLLAITIASDWIASNHQIFQPPSATIGTGKDYLEAARAQAREALDRIGIEARSKRPAAPPQWERICPAGPPRGVQCLVAELVEHGVAPGLAIIEAPMGEGKTEAAIHLGEHWVRTLGLSGMYIALPTQATSNQMHRRYLEYLQRANGGAVPLLVHGMAWLLDDAARHATDVEIDAGAEPEQSRKQRQEAQEWLRNARRALLAPHAVGTIDQVLFVALAVRFGALRLLGLSGKVLIVDEVHACDAFMQKRLERVLEWCRVLGTPVILLSATLSRGQRDALVHAYLGGKPDYDDGPADYPLVTVVDPRTSKARRIAAPLAKSRVSPVPLSLARVNLGDPDERAKLAGDVIDAVRGGGCAAVILNTVGGAQAFYRTLRDLAPDGIELVLFHARFPAWRRQELERLVEARFGKNSGDRRPARAILVATQVAEQSLDIDFDILFSEIAPIDRLLQRMGRMWRHDRGERAVGPRLHVIVPADGYAYGPSESVYSSIHLLRTHGVLETIDAIDVPGSFQHLIEQVFGDPLALCGRIPAEELETASERAEREREKEEKEAGRHLIGPPDPEEFLYPGSFVEAVKEGEAHESDDYLRARTRLGDYTRPIFALTRPEDALLIHDLENDPKDFGRIRKLFLTRVSVPRHWLAAPEDGQPSGTPELFGTPVIDLVSNSERSELTYDPELGIVGPERRS